MFILLDEIYDLCVYDEDPKRPFASAVQLFQTKEAKDKLIWLWGMSKVIEKIKVFFNPKFSEFHAARASCRRPFNAEPENSRGGRAFHSWFLWIKVRLISHPLTDAQPALFGSICDAPFPG